MIDRLASFELTLSEELRAFARYLVRLPQFVREKIPPAEAQARIRGWLGRRR